MLNISSWNYKEKLAYYVLFLAGHLNNQSGTIVNVNQRQPKGKEVQSYKTKFRNKL